MGICVNSSSLSLDQNMNGITTISDVFGLLKNIFWFPGNLFVEMLDSPSFNGFFEISYQNCNGIFSTLISLIVWFVLIPWALK